MATQDDLVIAVLEELVITGAGEDIEPEDSALVKRRYLRIREELSRRFLVDWDADDDIPDAALAAMALLVADDCAPAFGKPKDAVRAQEGTGRLWDYRNTPILPTPQMWATYY